MLTNFRERGREGRRESRKETGVREKYQSIGRILYDL